MTDAHAAHPLEGLTSRARDAGVEVVSEEFAQLMDSKDELAGMRDEFLFPKTGDGARWRESGARSVYLCGNSLGLQPRGVRKYVLEELDKWEEHGVEGHFRSERPWMTIDEVVKEDSARLVGARPEEVVVMNSLTTNLHLMMVPFYRPTEARFKILIEAKAFPSDWHAVQAQAKLHGLDPNEAIVALRPREGEEVVSTADVVAAIKEHGPSLALVLLPGIQYYTGQFYDIPTITAAAHGAGCIAGFDLAHAAGNVPMELHDWGVDFACWCSYKYLNSGPGGIAGCFVHERWAEQMDRPRLAGWWGHRKEDRFQMHPEFVPTPGAAGYQLSNPPVLPVVALRASLDLFAAAGMDRLRAKSERLVAFLEHCLGARFGDRVRVVTPKDPARRGCQLSLNFALPEGVPIRAVNDVLSREGVVCDVREPNVMRVAAAPLYNSFQDLWDFCTLLERALEEVHAGASA